MSSFKRVELEPFGVSVDTNPLDVENEWTSVQNIRFNNSAAEKIKGEVAGTTTTTEPYHLQFNGNHTVPVWVYMGNGTIHASDFTTDTDLDTGLTLSPGTNWDSSLFNMYPIMNNEINPPKWWDNIITNSISTLPAFPVDTRCKSIKPFRGFMVAMNIIEGANEQRNRVIWSDLADGGALPASWDIADPTKLAGDVWLTEDRAEIVGGLTLRDFFVIYKTHSMIIMRLTGGQSVMSFQKSQINSGLLAKNCVQEFKGQHFVVSDADVVLFDGQNIESIADKRVRAEIFDNIDVDNFRNTYTVRFDKQDEMWICYPTTGQTYPNRAAIWNWKDNTWSFRDLNDSRHIAPGLANFAVSPTYDLATYTYDSVQAQVPYNPIANNPTSDTLVNATSLSLSILDEGYDNILVPMPALLEKTSMTLGEEDKIKYIKSVTPQLTASVGTTLYIRVGTQMNPDEAITWSTEQPYVVGTDREAFFHEKGRYISIRFRSQDLGDDWKLHKFYFKVKLSGKY